MPCRFRMLPYGMVWSDNKGEEAMPDKVKWKSVDLSTFLVYRGEAYQPPLVTVGEKPLDRDDDGRWGGEVRD